MNLKQVIIVVTTLLIIIGVYLCQPEIIVTRQYPSLADMEKTQKVLEKRLGHATLPIDWSRPPLDIIIRLHGLNDETQKPDYRSPHTISISGIVLCLGLVCILRQQVVCRKNKEHGESGK